MMSTTLLTPATLAQTIPQHHAQQASVLDVFVSSSTASTASTATSGYGGESTSSSKSSSQSRLEEVGNGSGGAFGPPYNNSQQASPATTPHALSTLGDEEDLAAQTRDRSNTWPLRRPNLDINAQTSPLIHEQIPEEDNDMFGSEEHLTPGLTEPMMAGTPEGPHHDFDIASPLVGTQPPPSATPDTADGAGNASKKSTTRRNAWGNMSYADLITQAIMSSPEKKLTLSQVYEWMVQNVPYFRDKGDSNSSAGWKNSIRHNLSLHNRFMRIQNEGAGKSSWWVINPDAKPGRNPRRPRAATMDNTTKVSMEKKRRGAKKRVDMPGNIRGPGLSANSLVGSQASILSHGDVYDDEPMSSFDTFRPRTQSTISIPATTSRVSPSMDSGTFDEFDFPPWVDQAQQAQAQQAVQAAAAAAAAPHCVNELLDRTCQIRIGDNGVPDASSFSRMLNGSHLNGIKTSPTQIKQETLSNGGIKLQNEINGVHPPPSYHELNSVRANSQLQQNPLLRNQLQSHLLGAKLSAPPPVVGFPCFSTPMYTAIAAGCPSTMLQWPGPSTTATLVSQPISCGQSAGLPTDLENLNLPDHSLMDLDMESLLRHELELSQNEKLGFD